MDKYIIAIYLRLSIDDKKVESMSIESQRILLRKHAELLDYDDIEIIEYVDNGYSGTNFERPAVQKLLEDIKAFRINCIMVKDFSRFGRNSIEVGYFTQQVFPLFNVRFVSIGDYYDSDDHKGDTGGLEVTFKYLVNEYYSKDLSVKTKTAKYMKMRNGEYNACNYAYGYKEGENGEQVIDEAVADNVRLIFTLASEGKMNSEISKILFEKNIPTPMQHKKSKGKYTERCPNCKYWASSSITRILDNETYMGMFVMCKQTVQDVGSKKLIKRDESEWIKIPNHHPAIVSEELFEKVRKTKRVIKMSARQERTYPLRAKVMCGNCKHSMDYSMRKYGAFFYCTYTRNDMAEPCHKHKIYESDLHKVLFDIISKQAELILNVDSISDVDTLSVKTEKSVDLEKQIEVYQQKKQKLYEQLLMQEISKDEYMELKAQYDATIQNMSAQYDRSRRDIEQAKSYRESLSQAKQIAKSVQKENTLTQALADMLIDKVYVYPDNRIEVVWKIKDFCTEKNILATA